ncbi:MAG TPA: metallophosphoesterase [Candidatus Dormibacteraeota bacterium]|nr:metallophosphoesterase [Candidatus Dormibacteraeota bacterium]
MRLRAPAHGGLGRLGLLLILVASLGTWSTPARGAGECLTQEPEGRAYRVILCIEQPASGASLTGMVPASATVTVEGAQLGVRSLVFYLDDAYLLTDFEEPFEFVIPSERFVDGPHTLAFEAFLRDDLLTERASVAVTFSNGTITPPLNTNRFEPRAPAPVPGKPYVVAAVGDGAGGEATATRVTDLIKSWDPSMMLYLGDVYEKGTPTEFLNWYGTESVGYGQFRAITNPTIGDHEFVDDKAPGYFDYWDNVPFYYSFDAAGWHFVSLDATGHSASAASDGAQYQWLEADLRAHAGECTLAFFHRPVFSIGPHRSSSSSSSFSMRPIWSLLRAHSVALVLTGNDHDYQRWQPLDGEGNPDPDGVIEMVVGTGGHGIRGFAGSDPRMVAGSDSPDQAYGALRLQLGPRGAAFAFQNIAQTVLDEGAFACPGTAPDAAPPSAPGDLAASVSSPTRAALSWTAATDDALVTTYVIERDGTEIGRTDSMTTGFEDRTLQPQGTYAYSVRAVDIAGNLSDPDNATVTTPALATVRPIAFPSISSAPEDVAAGDGPPAWLLVVGGGALIAAFVVFLRPRRAIG